MFRKIIFFLVALLPLTRAFGLKLIILRYAGVVVGSGVCVVSSAKFITSGALSIGENSWIGHEVMLVGGGASISIGANCDIAPRVMFVTGTHQINPEGPHVAGSGYSLPISVGDGSWIGAGAIILGGTVIGVRSIVAAGAVVNGIFPPGVLIGGVPARIIKNTLVATRKE